MESESDGGEQWESMKACSAANEPRKAKTDDHLEEKSRSEKRKKSGRSRAATEGWQTATWRVAGTEWAQSSRHRSWKAAGDSWSSWAAAAAWSDAWLEDWEHGSKRGAWKSDAWAGSDDWSKRGYRGSAATFTSTKLQCQFQVGIEEEPTFRVVRRLLGPAGQHMKDIAQDTGAKLRLRGRGSKFLEGPEQLESTDPLMLCVSVESNAGYVEAVERITALLEGIYADYGEFCAKTGKRAPELWVDLHEGPREGSR